VPYVIEEIGWLLSNEIQCQLQGIAETI